MDEILYNIKYYYTYMKNYIFKLINKYARQYNHFVYTKYSGSYVNRLNKKKGSTFRYFNNIQFLNIGSQLSSS